MKLAPTLIAALLLAPLAASHAAAATTSQEIDRETLDKWSAQYRSWHYQPGHVIPANPDIPGHADFKNTDVPCVYQLPGQPDKWCMSFIAFNGQGYNSFVAESTNLVEWTNPRLAMGFGKPGEFDFGGCVIGAFLYESYDIKSPRILKRREGRFWTLYGCYAKQGGYEVDPGYEGVANSKDGLTWRRAKDTPILSIHDPDCADWEKDCIYQPWLVEHEGKFYNFYNAKRMPVWIEQMGGATSTDLLNWKRFDNNPIVPVRKGGYDEKFCADGKVFRDGDHWVMFYFGVGKGGAHIMAAFSRDLVHWTAHPEPLYKAGGNPSGLDQKYAHKISLVYNPKNETFYLYYCAAGNQGRGIGLITSKPLSGTPAAPATDEADAATTEPHVFDARAFGVKGDDATDNTEAFSRCLKAVVEAGGGRVILLDGVYRGRIIIPPVSRPSPSWITVEITGEHEPTPVFGTIGSFPLQNRGTILKCLAESGPSVITAVQSDKSLYGGFSAVNVVLKNLDVRTYDNPGIGGIDLKGAMQCKLENVFINTGVYNVRASKPTRQTSGLITPAANNAAWTILRNVTVTGYYNGIVVNEHTDGDNIVIGSNLHGLNFAQAHHASRFARVSSCRNVNTVTVSGAHGFSIEQLNIEQPGPKQTDDQNHWQITESDVNDPGNVGVADINYWVVIGNVGARDVFLKKGGASIQSRRIGSAR